ncbi:MAG: serine--tRNA ligase [Myxococcales bacterium]|nr:MAG: serine--tRNA ligase [Myxococcales bacterium]
MLDVRYVVNNLDEVRARLAMRKADALLAPIVDLDAKRRTLITAVEEMRRRQNEANQEMQAVVKREGPKSETLASMRQGLKDLSAAVKAKEPELDAIEQELSAAMLDIPNLPHASTPVGASEEENVVRQVVGEPPKFAFEPRWHDDLGQALGVLDFERGAKLSGARFTVLRGLGARLERALAAFMLDTHLANGYTEIAPPLLVSAETMTGTGQLPKFKADLFQVTGLDRELYLIPTAEVPLTNLHADEVLDAEALPLHYCGFTPCFRSEAGSYGKDVRGYIRQHQFNKVELVHICRPETSYEELELLTRNAEGILRKLELPYRRVALCTGDLGFAATKTYDLEVWLPGQGKYREISSCSNCEDFQARRMKLRFKEKGGKPRFCHTLNGSGLAVGRTLVAVLENFQEADGSVRLPQVLRPYLGGLERLRPA